MNTRIRRTIPTFVASLGAILVLGLAAVASARTPVTVGYSKAQVYSAALRHLRVDLALEVYEKDPEAAYLLFRYSAQGAERRVSDGSIEVITVKTGCRVVIQLPKLPSYYEQALKESLLDKLRGDYGAPDTAKPEAPKPPKEPPGTSPKEGADRENPRKE